MKLDQKKNLAGRVLGIGKERIIFDSNRMDEIKEAITRQDIKDLVAAGAIQIKDIKGRRKIEKRKRRGEGSIKKVINQRKTRYVMITRKLRRILKDLKDKKRLDNKRYREVRGKIKSRKYKTTAQFMEEMK